MYDLFNWNSGFKFIYAIFVLFLPKQGSLNPSIFFFLHISFLYIILILLFFPLFLLWMQCIHTSNQSPFSFFLLLLPYLSCNNLQYHHHIQRYMVTHTHTHTHTHIHTTLPQFRTLIHTHTHTHKDRHLHMYQPELSVAVTFYSRALPHSPDRCLQLMAVVGQSQLQARPLPFNTCTSWHTPT